MARKITDKEAFFRELEQLDDLSDGCEEKPGEGDFSRLLALSRGSNESVLPGVAFSPKLKSLPALNHSRSTSDIPLSSVSVADLRRDRGESVGLSEGTCPPAVRRSNTLGAFFEKAKASMSTGKRKRACSSKAIPEQQQIFKGLVFFFFPNSDVSPVRRLRIQRVQEYGATWAKALDDNVTHVIVDKGITFQDVLKHLKLESFPKDIALLDESYPSECIKFRSVLSTALVRFRVTGMPVPQAKETAPADEPSSAASLPLKSPAKEPQYTPTPLHISDSQSERAQHSREMHTQDKPEERCEQLIYEQPIHKPHPSHERDALDDMIDEARAVKDLPLEPLDDEPIESSDAGTFEGSDSEAIPKRKKSVGKGDGAKHDWQQKFACMRKHDSKSNSEGPNSKTIEILQQMLDYYTRTDDHWRVLAYRKAISALRGQSRKITNKTQALSIPGIGQRLADKIEEIVLTNRLRRLENTNTTPEDQIFQEFLGVYGVGISQASKWVAQGYRSLEDLKTKAHLSTNQLIGLEHYHDFSQRIPRSEVEAHGEVVRKAVQKVNPDMQVIVSGSYRRGAATSGDVDVLITEPDATIEQIRTMMVETVVPELFKQGYLQVSLAATSRGDGSKWHGASMLPGSDVWRRIDLLFVPGSEIGAALLYFTGNDIFNRSMRLLARKKGMRLNQRGLYTDVMRGPNQVKLATGRLVEGRDERRIFEILGVPWRPPEHRIC